MFRKKQVLEVQFAEAVPKAFGKIQTGLEIYLVNQLKLRGWSVDKKLVKDTMSHLISNVDLDGNSVDKARVLVEFLKAKPELMEVFCKAVRIKVALMTQEGMPADALKLIKNLKVYGIQAVYIDQQPPPPKEFVNMANDFVLLCNTLDEKPAEVDEDWARRLWEPEPQAPFVAPPAPRAAPNFASMGDAPTGGQVDSPFHSMGDSPTMPPQEDFAESTNAETLPALDNRYWFKEMIGRGTFGQVFKAWDEKLARMVAVKRCSLDGFHRDVFSEVLKEARAAAGLNHPGIVHVYDVQSDNAGCYIIMELVEGRSLRRHLQEERRFDEARALRIIMSACLAVDHAHQQGVVHRDLKPENILLTGDDGAVKVVDFGLARFAHEEQATRSGNAAGTLMYMAPEQLSNFNRAAEPADIFSLGKILFEMLSGYAPLSVDLSLLQTDQKVRGLVEKASRMDPAARYPSVKAMLGDLAQLRGTL